MSEKEFISSIEKKINNAARSFSDHLMYGVMGYVEGLASAGVISTGTYTYYSGRICRDWLNNGKWRNLADRDDIFTNDDLNDKKKACLAEKGL